MKQLPEHLRNQEPIGNLGALTIRLGNQPQHGSCNFCTRPTAHIHILNGQNLEIRVCDHCLRIIQEYQP